MEGQLCGSTMGDSLPAGKAYGAAGLLMFLVCTAQTIWYTGAQRPAR
jgi:hypothetical protein